MQPNVYIKPVGNTNVLIIKISLMKFATFNHNRPYLITPLNSNQEIRTNRVKGILIYIWNVILLRVSWCWTTLTQMGVTISNIRNDVSVYTDSRFDYRKQFLFINHNINKIVDVSLSFSQDWWFFLLHIFIRFIRLRLKTIGSNDRLRGKNGQQLGQR